MVNGGNWQMPVGTTDLITIVSQSCPNIGVVGRVVVRQFIEFVDTLTGKTQWTRPGGDAFVIPLGLIQVSLDFRRRAVDNGASG